jgi:PKD repeat protein
MITYGQVVLTQQMMYQSGDFYTIQPCSTKNISNPPSQAGANININYSNLIANGQSVKTTFDIDGAILKSNYTENSTLANDYFSIDSNKINLVKTFSNFDIYRVFKNPKLLYSFPTNFGDTFTDYSDFEWYARSGRCTTKGYCNTTIIADAYGEITLPTGTFPYLRLKVIDNEQDTSYSGQFCQNQYINNYTITSYLYMNPAYKTPLFYYAGNNYSYYYLNGSTDKPKADFVFSNTQNGQKTVSFTNKTTNSSATKYLWDFGVDTLLNDTSSAINPIYTFPANGTYNVRLIAYNPFISYTDTVFKKVTILPSSVNNNNEWINQNIKLFPNPASQNLTIYFEKLLKKNVKIKLCDIEGKSIQLPTNLTTTANAILIDISALNKGFYSITIEDETISKYFKFMVE